MIAWLSREPHLAFSYSNCIGLQRLRTIRHPGILKYIDGDETETATVIVTEPVIPLALAIASIAPEQICLGIYSILVSWHRRKRDQYMEF